MKKKKIKKKDGNVLSELSIRVEVSARYVERLNFVSPTCTSHLQHSATFCKPLPHLDRSLDSSAALHLFSPHSLNYLLAICWLLAVHSIDLGPR